MTRAERIEEAAKALLALIGRVTEPAITPDVRGTYNQRVEALFVALAPAPAASPTPGSSTSLTFDPGPVHPFAPGASPTPDPFVAREPTPGLLRALESREGASPTLRKECPGDGCRGCQYCAASHDDSPSDRGASPTGDARPEFLARCPATPDGRLPPDEISACEFCGGTAYCAGESGAAYPPGLEPRVCLRVTVDDDDQETLCAEPYGERQDDPAKVTCEKCRRLLPPAPQAATTTTKEET